jgi:hypothetical protein
MKGRWFAVVFFIGHQLLFSQQAGLDELIQKIDARTKSYPEYKNYSATAVSKSWEMDSKWRPEKQVVVTKRIVKQGDGADETILSAVEISKGVEKDVTEKMKETARKEKEKQARKKREKSDLREQAGGKDGGEKKEEEKGGGGSFTMSNEQLYPFSGKKAGLYTFTQLADTAVDGKTLLRIRAEAKTDNPETYEGLFFIDPETWDVLFMDEWPSKNPKFVKRMRMKMEFTVMPGNFYVFKRFWMSVEASFLVKKIRMEFEESHSDVQVSG